VTKPAANSVMVPRSPSCVEIHTGNYLSREGIKYCQPTIRHPPTSNMSDNRSVSPCSFDRSQSQIWSGHSSLTPHLPFLSTLDFNCVQGSDRRFVDAENQNFQLRTRRKRVPATAIQYISVNTQHFFDYNKYYLYYVIFDYYYCLFYKY